ncbi:response regulator receiver modulated GAF sensor protein [Halogeometricum pallidum JCM 14848]|uniref:Response regulator receiver modulated GAF sensor protein n=1 Tax=Halogeometricum pallidum JCM 14848 TaxID=1227487 RepID=M0DAF4_HALPD|nr:bacterio-opsin activator domain-containing protein [Halogeometricum pallidum]ELZ31149.1 response regulator receiver modulated GAF sensor protein [Halogeometricum pallidum JCM 14848]
MSSDEPLALYVDADSDRSDALCSTLRESHPNLRLRTVTTASAAETALSESSVDCVVARLSLTAAESSEVNSADDGATALNDGDAPSAGDGVDFLASVAARYPSVTTVLFDAEHSPELLGRVRGADVDEYVRDTGPDDAAVLGDHVVALTTRSEREFPTRIQLRTLLGAFSDVVLSIDEESTIRFVNPAVENVLGYPPDELIGRPLTVLMPEEMREQHQRGLARYLETGERTLDWEEVELPAVHRDGHEVQLSIAFNELRYDEERRFIGVARDVTDQKRRERELERYEAMVQTVQDGIYVLDDRSRFVAVNRAYTELVGRSEEDLLGTAAATVSDDETTEEIESLLTELLRNDENAVTYETTVSTPRGDVPLEARISPFPLGDGTYGRVGVVRDITDRQRRETQLASLNETAQALTTAETSQEVCELAVRAAAETLDFPLSDIKLYDDRGELVVTARTEAAEEYVGDGSLFGPDSDVPWRVYASSTSAVFDDVAAEESSESPLRSAVVLPIGKYGVFVSGRPEADAFSETDVILANILVANVRAALERTDREQTLREQKEELEARTTSLERVNRINTVIRDLTRALTEATSREEIEQVVCTQLVNADPYRFAWIGEQETVSGELVPKTSAGVGRGYLDEITVTADDSPTGRGPAGRALRTREPQVQNNFHTDPPFEPWRAKALQRGFRASTSIPLVYKETMYGVLNLYADEPGVFDDLEVNVLEELGKSIGFAINALERRKALVSDRAVELEFRMDDVDVPPVTLARETDTTFELDALVERGDGEVRIFFVVGGIDPDETLSLSSQLTTISDGSLIAERDDGYLFEATLEDGNFFGALLDYGAYPTGFTATPDGATLTVELPRTGDIRAFLDMLLRTYDGVELVARRELERPIQTESEFRALYRKRLTDRQEEVLRTAYFAGFFDWPREATGKQVAELLDVSQPTVNRHIRKGE